MNSRRGFLMIVLVLTSLLSKIDYAQNTANSQSVYEKYRQQLETTEQPQDIPPFVSDDWVVITGKWKIEGNVIRYVGGDPKSPAHKVFRLDQDDFKIFLEKMPKEIVDKLNTLKDKYFKDKNEFLEEVKKAIGEDLMYQYQSLILESAVDPYGILLNKGRIWNGSVETVISFPEKFREEYCGARILFSYNPVTKNYYSAGFGGEYTCNNERCAYVLSEFIQNSEDKYNRQPPYIWKPITQFGYQRDLFPKSDYKTTILLNTNTVRLLVNNVKVIENDLPHPLYSDHVGL